MSIIALALLLLVIILHLREKRYRVEIYVNGKHVKSYRTNYHPVRGNAIYLVKDKKVYYVNNMINLVQKNTESVVISCEDISNTINEPNSPINTTGSVPQ